MKRGHSTTRFWAAATLGALMTVASVRIQESVRNQNHKPPAPPTTPHSIEGEFSAALPRLGRIRSQPMASGINPDWAPRVTVDPRAPAAGSDVEEFFVRHLDPWFRGTGGWQFYNPDRLDRGQESARSTSLAFAAGIRYRHSF